MKRLLLLLSLNFALLFPSTGQECTTLWPYLYPDFKKGTLFFTNNDKVVKEFNVHVKDGALHYLDNQIIKKSSNQDILHVIIDEDTLKNVDGQFMKIIGARENEGYVATLVLGDFDRLFNTQGAYGASSSSSSVTKLSSLILGGIHIINLMELEEKQDEGLPLPLKYRNFIVFEDKVMPASRRGIIKRLDRNESSDFRKFLRNNNIDWSDPQSLITILDFFNN